MGFDIRVNNGRCPPFLLGGCILLCVVLVCNWWSFSSQNYELLRQIDILEEQMRTCCGERDTCTYERNKLEGNLGELNIKIDRLQKEVKTNLDRFEKDLTICKTELESLKQLDTSKTESLNELRTSLDEKKEEIKQLNEEVQRLTVLKDEALKKNNDEHETTEQKEKDGERDQLMANQL